ncbi:leucine-rich repeat-containing protein 40 isoform X1 [Cephus cinctus]|uniref:Leucine-rich repeat-containing protein 40 isoform X1 n=1 Tax=Cephus cinctus TaxID=211228 RepID=A0AAJ7FFT5_CEPCN|nr:leucine-rich repeat-containing protein 40 isoform X1 [Cephus cinctus]
MKSGKMSVTRNRINHRSVFKPRTKNDDNAELSEDMVISARKTGQLNLSTKGLSTVPNRVWSINELTPEEIRQLDVGLEFNDDKEKWWEQEPLKILDLSSNSLTELDPKVEFLSELSILDLHDNIMETLPAEIGNLSKLRKLNSSFNKIKHLPLNFYNLSELRHLDLRNNLLKELDPAIGDLIMLDYMNLSCNNLISLPIGMGYLVRLVSLDISHNMLKELPPDITSMRVLKKLDANSNNLEILPPFGELRHMEVLVLHTNNLKNFPDTTGCAALRELHLANNSIDEIDVSGLESMGQLRTLTLANNKIKEIPEEIVQLLNLERLDLSCNNISKVPGCIGIMPNLQNFVIDGNKLQNLRRDIIQCGTHRILRHLRESIEMENVESRGFSSLNANDSIFPDKYVMRNTRLLSLTGQNLQEIPQAILEDASEAQITCIDLSRNKFCNLQDNLSIVTTITDLKLRCNQLSSLPDWIGEKYKHLRFIDLSNNRLSSLPASISLLEYLLEINISYNRFTKLPDCIYDIERLEILTVGNNQLSLIDVSSLSKLRRLATLDLSNNNIVFVPPELGNLKNLRTLLLSGNYFKQPRQATLMKGTEEILAYLRDRIPT